MKVALPEVFPLLYSKKYKAWLLYGNKPHLIEHILNEVQDSDIRFLRTQDQEFWDQFIEMCAPTLFNVGRVVIVIQEVPERKFSLYQAVLKKLPENVQLVFTSSQFRQHSSWVKNFQKSTEWASVSAYELSLEHSVIILKRCLAKYHVPLSSNQLKIVSQWVQEGDWVSTTKTLQLLYHAKNKDPIQQEDLEQLFHHCVLDSEEIFLPFLEHPNIEVIRHLQNNDQKMKWIRAWQKLAWQCWQLKIALKQSSKCSSGNITTVATQLDPPIFFKHLPFIKENIDRWSLEFLRKIMDTLYDLEIEIKKGTFKDEITICRMLTQSVFTSH